MRIVLCTDLHIGHPKLSLDNFLTNIEVYLYPEILKSNIVIFGGDIFDRMLKLDEMSAQLAVKIISDILEICEKNKIIIRILRGTFTHDRNQNELFITLSEGMEIDIRYIDTVDLDYIKPYKLKFLYIPDDLVYKTSEECLDVVNELLEQNKWDKVDFVIGHGYFHHRLPKNIPHEPKCTFRLEQFTRLVKYNILMGHIHVYSKYYNCYYSGSFERLNHGEEEDKGFLVLEYNEIKDEWVVERVINHDTIPFITIEIPEHIHEYEVAVNYLEQEVLNKFKDKPRLWGYLRIKCNDTELRQQLEFYASNKWNDILKISSISSKQEKMLQNYIPNDLDLNVSSMITPTVDNIADLIYDYLNKNNRLGNTNKDILELYIKELYE